MNGEDDGSLMEIVIQRVGECRRCGWCCGACEHLELPNVCRIYEKRKELGYENCVFFPDMPFRKLNPKCGYRFVLKPRETDKIMGTKNGQEVLNIEVAPES